MAVVGEGTYLLVGVDWGSSSEGRLPEFTSEL